MTTLTVVAMWTGSMVLLLQIESFPATHAAQQPLDSNNEFSATLEGAIAYRALEPPTVVLDPLLTSVQAVGALLSSTGLANFIDETPYIGEIDVAVFDNNTNAWTTTGFLILPTSLRETQDLHNVSGVFIIDEQPVDEEEDLTFTLGTLESTREFPNATVTVDTSIDKHEILDIVGRSSVTDIAAKLRTELASRRYALFEDNLVSFLNNVDYLSTTIRVDMEFVFDTSKLTYSSLDELEEASDELYQSNEMSVHLGIRINISGELDGFLVSVRRGIARSIVLVSTMSIILFFSLLYLLHRHHSALISSQDADEKVLAAWGADDGTKLRSIGAEYGAIAVGTMILSACAILPVSFMLASVRVIHFLPSASVTFSPKVLIAGLGLSALVLTIASLLILRRIKHNWQRGMPAKQRNPGVLYVIVGLSMYASFEAAKYLTSTLQGDTDTTELDLALDTLLLVPKMLLVAGVLALLQKTAFRSWQHIERRLNRQTIRHSGLIAHNFSRATRQWWQTLVAVFFVSVAVVSLVISPATLYNAEVKQARYEMGGDFLVESSGGQERDAIRQLLEHDEEVMHTSNVSIYADVDALPGVVLMVVNDEYWHNLQGQTPSNQAGFLSVISADLQESPSAIVHPRMLADLRRTGLAFESRLLLRNASIEYLEVLDNAETFPVMRYLEAKGINLQNSSAIVSAETFGLIRNATSDGGTGSNSPELLHAFTLGILKDWTSEDDLSRLKNKLSEFSVDTLPAYIGSVIDPTLDPALRVGLLAALALPLVAIIIGWMSVEEILAKREEEVRALLNMGRSFREIRNILLGELAIFAAHALFVSAVSAVLFRNGISNLIITHSDSVMTTAATIAMSLCAAVILTLLTVGAGAVRVFTTEFRTKRGPLMASRL